MELTKQQRSEKKMAPALGPLWILFVVIVLIAAAGLAGCGSTTLDKTAAVCLGEGRDFEYTRSEGYEKASCSGGRSTGQNVKVSR